MTFEQAQKLLSITPFFILIPIFSFLWIMKKDSSALRLIGIYLVINLVAGMVSLLFWKMGKPNLWVLHIYPPIELPVVLLAINHHLKRPSTKLVYFVSLAFLIFSIFNSCFIQPIIHFNSNGRLVESLIIISACMVLLSQLSSNHQKALLSIPFFWICIGLFIYFSASLFIFGMSNTTLFKDRTMNLWIWVFHAFVLLIHHVLFSVGFYKLKRI